MFTQIHAGVHHTCAIDDAQAIHCWGLANDPGGTDYGVVTDAPTEGAYTVTAPGDKHSCALDTDGIGSCWGANFFGAGAPPAEAFTDLEAGISTCAIRASDASLICFGDPFSALQFVPDGAFIDVATDENYACAIDIYGAVQCWGTFWQWTPRGLDGKGQRFVQLAVSRTMVCGLTEGGDVICGVAP